MCTRPVEENSVSWSPGYLNMVGGGQQNAVISEKEVSRSSFDQLFQSYIKSQNDLIRDQQKRLQDMVDRDIRIPQKVLDESIRRSQEIAEEGNRRMEAIVQANMAKVEERSPFWQLDVLHSFSPVTSTETPGLDEESMSEESSASNFSKVTAEPENHQIQWDGPASTCDVSQETKYKLCKNDSDLNSPEKEEVSSEANLESTQDVFTMEAQENSDFKLDKMEVVEELESGLHAIRVDIINEAIPPQRGITLPSNEFAGHQEKLESRRPEKGPLELLVGGGSKSSSMIVNKVVAASIQVPEINSERMAGASNFKNQSECSFKSITPSLGSRSFRFMHIHSRKFSRFKSRMRKGLVQDGAQVKQSFKAPINSIGKIPREMVTPNLKVQTQSALPKAVKQHRCPAPWRTKFQNHGDILEANHSMAISSNRRWGVS